MSFLLAFRACWLLAQIEIRNHLFVEPTQPNLALEPLANLTEKALNFRGIRLGFIMTIGYVIFKKYSTLSQYEKVWFISMRQTIGLILGPYGGHIISGGISDKAS